MAFRDYLEQYTIGEMTFGIEIEGLVGDVEDRDELLAYFKELLPSHDVPERSMKDDPSIDGGRCEYCDGAGYVDDYRDEDGNGEAVDCDYCNGTGKIKETFEFATPVMSLTPKNISMMIHFFEESFKHNLFFTNESCGMHVHIGLPDSFNSAEDRFWILCQMANDDYWNKFIQHMEVDDKDFDFVSLQYASHGAMNDISRALKNQADARLSSIFNSDKYRIMRIHPNYNTIEWRGPRNFLNENKIEYVKTFFYDKLIPIVKMFTKMQIKDTITWGDGEISRKDFFELVKTKDTELKYGASIKKRQAKNDNRWDVSQNPSEIGKLLKMYPDFLSDKFAESRISAYVSKDGKNIIIEKGSFTNITFNSLFEFDGDAHFEECHLEKVRLDIFGKMMTHNTHFSNCQVSSYGRMVSCVFDDCVIKNAYLDDCRCDKCTINDAILDTRTTYTNSKKITGSIIKSAKGSINIDTK